MSAAPSAFVFDCDGVLVDSEPHSVAAWLAVTDALGHPATAADVAACTGLGFATTRHRLTQRAPLPPVEDLWPRLLGALRSEFESGLVVFSDALAMVEAAVAAGIPLAVASASPRQRLDLTLEVAGLVDRFPVSVAGDEVADPKPAPDVYLAAVERLSVAGPVWAVEDSPAGAVAARAAGLVTIGVVRQPAMRAGLEAAGARCVERLSPALIEGVPGPA